MRSMRTPIEYQGSDGRLRLHAEESGPRDGALTVLCLHGLTRNSRDFDALVSRLALRYRVITADQRGRGRSQWDPTVVNYQIPVYANDMMQLLDRLEVERVVLIGTSMGGFISMALGASQTSRVRGMVLNDIGPEVPAAGLERLRESLHTPARVSTWDDAALHAKRVNQQAFPEYSEADWHAFARRIYVEDSTGRPVPAYDPEILTGLSQPPGPNAVTPTFWPLWEQLRSIPMLVIRGGLSDILSVEILGKMAARHPNLATLTLPDRGHAPMLDEPAAVLAVERFLEGLQCSSRT
jgi:pimeloyl-ACP methyl ester carboxylesterase